MISTLITALLISFCTASNVVPMYQRSYGINSEGGRTDVATAMLTFYSLPLIHECFLTSKKDPNDQFEDFASIISSNIKNLAETDSIRNTLKDSTVKTGLEGLVQVLDFIGLCIKRLGHRELKPLKFNSVSFLINMNTKTRQSETLEIRFWKTFRVGTGYLNLSSAINDKFMNEAATRVIQFKYPHLETAFLFKTIPEVLTFYLHRNESPESNLVMLEKSLTVGKIEFELAVRIIYNTKLSTTEVIAHDFGSDKDYLYKNSGEVAELSTDPDVKSFPDFDSRMVFYVKKSTVEHLKRLKLEAIDKKRKFDNSSGDSNHSESGNSSKRSRTLAYENLVTKRLELDELNKVSSSKVFEDTLPPKLANKLKSIYWINPEDFDAGNDRIEVFKWQRDVLARLATWSPENLDIFARLTSPNFYLGVSSSSFKPAPEGMNYTVLEIALSAIASNLKSCIKLIVFYKTRTINRISRELIFVILKMVLGFKNISLDNLAKEFANFDLSFADSIADNLRKSLFKLFAVIRTQVRDGIIEAPYGKVIEYTGMSSDDPIRILTDQAQIIFINSVVSPSSASDIPGVWYDFAVRSRINRYRTIYRSNCDTFCVGINREIKGVSKTVIISGAKFERVENGYEVVGAVLIDRDNNAVKAVFKNDFYSGSCRIYRSGEGSDIKKLDLKSLSESIDCQAVVIFYSKPEFRVEKLARSKIFAGHIQEKFEAEVLKEMAEEVNLTDPADEELKALPVETVNRHIINDRVSQFDEKFENS